MSKKTISPKKTISEDSDSDVEFVITKKVYNKISNDSRNTHELYIKAQERIFQLECNREQSLNVLKKSNARYEELKILNNNKKIKNTDEALFDIRKGYLQGEALQQHCRDVFVKSHALESFETVLYNICGLKSNHINNDFLVKPP